MQNDSTPFTDCVAVLDDEEVATLHAYWDQVIAEAWGPGSLPTPGVVVDLAAHRQRRTIARGAQAAATSPFGGEVA